MYPDPVEEYIESYGPGAHKGKTSEYMEHGPGKTYPALQWGLILAWAGLIFYLSSRAFGPRFSRRLLALGLHLVNLHLAPHAFVLLDTLIRKLAHLVEYGIFALVLYWLPSGKGNNLWRPRRAVVCVLVATAYSLTDEFHQSFVPGRHASLFDCALDASGAALAMLICYISSRRRGGSTLVTS
jgi:VanZ family protein